MERRVVVVVDVWCAPSILWLLLRSSVHLRPGVEGGGGAMVVELVLMRIMHVHGRLLRLGLRGGKKAGWWCPPTPSWLVL